MLGMLSKHIKPGVWYVRRIGQKVGGTDERYWIVTNPAEVVARATGGTMDAETMRINIRTFPRHQWRAALDWAIQQSRGRVAPPVVPPPPDIRPVRDGVEIPRGPSRHFVAGADMDVIYPETSGGEVRAAE